MIMRRYLTIGLMFVAGMLLLTGEADSIEVTLAVKAAGILLIALVPILMRRWGLDEEE